MRLTTLLPMALAFLGTIVAMPADSNAERLQQGLPLKPPSTRVRRQATPSQSPGVNGLFEIERRGAASRRDLDARAAPTAGFMGLTGDTLTWTANVSDAVTINFPTDVGDQQPLRVRTGSGLQYISYVQVDTGIYELHTTPDYDGTSTFTWTSVTGQSAGSNTNGKAGTKSLYFRLDSDNDKLIGATTFASTPAQNPIWIFVRQGPSDVTSPAGLDAEARKMLDASNDFRARYGANPMTYNTTIAAYAQSIADTCVYEHSDRDGGKYGENLAYGYYTLDSNGAVKVWGPNEAPTYYSGVNGTGAGHYVYGAGHFTQLVWKSTTQVGCGYKLCPRYTLADSQDYEAMYIVCDYFPPGNYAGRFNEEVGSKVN